MSYELASGWFTHNSKLKTNASCGLQVAFFMKLRKTEK